MSDNPDILRLVLLAVQMRRQCAKYSSVCLFV